MQEYRWFWITFCCKWPTWSRSASLSGLFYPALLTGGLARVGVCLRTSHASPVSCSTPQVLKPCCRDRKGKEKLGFNRTTLSVDTIWDQWHFPLRKAFILFLAWETSHWILIGFLPGLLSRGVQHVHPEHSEVLVSILISISLISLCLRLAGLLSIWMTLRTINLTQKVVHYGKRAFSLFVLIPASSKLHLDNHTSALSCNAHWGFNYSAWLNKQIPRIIVSRFTCAFSPHFDPFLSWQLEKCHYDFCLCLWEFQQFACVLHLSLHVSDEWEHP